MQKSFEVYLGKKRQITLPPELLKNYGLLISSFKAIPQREGILLKPRISVDAGQVWFWSRKWQEGEKEADQDLEEGRVRRFESVKDLTREIKQKRKKRF